MQTSSFVQAIALALSFSALTAVQAQDAVQTQTQTQVQTQLQERDRIYAQEHMSQQERDDYMRRFNAAATEQERERIRQEHREKMDQRMRAMNENRNLTPKGAGKAGGPGRQAGQEDGAPLIPRQQGGGGRN